MESLSILILIAAIANLVLGIFVLFQNKHNPVNRYFGIFTLLTGFWVLTNFIFEVTGSAIFFRGTYALGILIPPMGIIWISYFEKQKLTSKNKILLRLLVITGLIFSLMSFYDNLIIERVGLTITTGSIFPIFALYAIGSTCIAIFKILKIFLKSRDIKRIQAKYILIGLGMFGFSTLLTSILCPLFNIVSLAKLDSPSSIFFIIFSAYAILKHHLLNIKVIATELLIGLVGMMLLTDLMITKDTSAILLKLLIFVVFIYLGISLIKSVLKEIKRREQLEKLTKQLEEANINLKKLDKAKSEFVSIASHQLRTPLTAIKGYMSMAIEGVYGKFDDRFTNVLKNVYGSNEELINLVNDLLNLSRIEAGKIKLEPEKVNLSELISAIINKLKINADQKGLIVTKEPMTLPLVMMDRDKIRQVLLNLIDNAIKYTQQGKITISAKKKNKEVIVEISDTGMGLSQEEMGNLFVSFKRGESGPKLHTEGSGLGLYIAKKFIDMHKGKIWAESEGKGKGSSFFISLPC